jgi:hypothetical protein
MLNKAVVVALALAFLTPAGALAATKKSPPHKVFSARAMAAYASVPTSRRSAEDRFWLDRAKGNINGE